MPAGEPGDPRRYSLLRCQRCGTAVTADPPPGEGAYEAGVYGARRPRSPALVRALQRMTVVQPARALQRAGLPRGARVLDVGAGAGRLVEELERRGLAAGGIEPSARSAALAAAAGRAVERRALEEHEETQLDAVAMWHVLEHLDDPLAALRRVHGWLRPRGILLVGVPNVASLQARVAGDAWLHFDAPRHRSHLTPRGLEALLGRAGFGVVRTRHLVWEHNPGAMWMALLSRAGARPGLAFHLLKRNIAPTPRETALLAAGVPAVPLAVALEALAAAARRGGTIAVVAQREA